jgi:RHS repeat-associated protein
VYDALGRRQRKTINGTVTDFVYDELNPVREVMGATAVDLLTGPSIDEYLLRVTSNSTEQYLSDALGSTIAIANGTGTIQTEYSYEPFGMATTGVSNGNEMAYTGREDDRTGLYYYRARYYHPGLQRFISEDPIGFAAGDANLYAYVRNSPTRFIDPSGLYTVEYTGPSAGCMRLGGRKDDCSAPTDPPPPMIACFTGCAGIMGGVTTASAAEGSGGRSGSPSMDAPRARLIATAMGTEAVHQIVTGVEFAGGGLLLIAAGGGNPVTTVIGLGFYVYGTYEIGSGFYTLYELSKLADPR